MKMFSESYTKEHYKNSITDRVSLLVNKIQEDFREYVHEYLEDQSDEFLKDASRGYCGDEAQGLADEWKAMLKDSVEDVFYFDIAESFTNLFSQIIDDMWVDTMVRDEAEKIYDQRQSLDKSP